MTTEVAQKSSFFPFGNKRQEENKAATRRMLVSFPQTRQILWDSDKIGSGMKLHLSSGSVITVKISEKTIRLAYQHAAHERGTPYHGFLVGTVETDAEEEDIEISLNRFDPGRELPSGQGPVLTAKLPGDFVVPVCFSFLKGDRTPTHGEENFISAFKFLEHSTSSREGVDLLNALSLRIHCLCYEGSDDITFSLHLGAVVVGTPVNVAPINPVPIIPTALARNLAGPISISQLQKNHKFGFITMDQTRKLLLLLDTDPKAYSLPLVGIWISGINYVHNPVVYTACLKFLFSKSIQDRATSPSGGFILLFYSPLHKQPLFFECEKGDSYHNLTFDLIGCKEQLHIYKHASSAASSDVHLELTAARDGPAKELFLQALRHYEPSSGSLRSRTRTLTPKANSDPHLVLRPSPKPTLTMSPSILPSVPEVSLIFDDSENIIPCKRSSPFVGQARPGPLRDLNQSQAQLQMRTGVISTQCRRFSASSAQGHTPNSGGEERMNRRQSCGSSPPHDCEEGEAGPRVSDGKGKKKRGNSGKKAKVGANSKRQRETKDGRTNSGQENNNDLHYQEIDRGPQLERSHRSGQDESGRCRDKPEEEEDGRVVRGIVSRNKRNNNQQRNISQNQTYPSAMPESMSRTSGQAKRYQSESHLSRAMSDKTRLNGQVPSNYDNGENETGYHVGPIQIGEKRYQREHSFDHSANETPSRLQEAYTARYGLQQSTKHGGAASQIGQSLQQSTEHVGAASQIGQSLQQSTEHVGVASQIGQSPQPFSPLQHEQVVTALQQLQLHQSLQQKSAPHQPRLQQQEEEHVRQPSVTASEPHLGRQLPAHQPQPLQQQHGCHVQQQQNPEHNADIREMDTSSTDGFREESAYVQLKKQEKMIEQLQEQIKYLLQLQAGNISTGLMTPPATPPSTKDHPGFPFPTPDSLSGKEMAGSNSKRDFGHTTYPESLSPKHVTTISTNTGQSLFFPESALGHSAPGSRRSDLSNSNTDAVVNSASRDSSARGSVSDTVLSVDPDFHVELENTHDDTQSLDKVEMRSFPDSGSTKSSQHSSPSRGNRQYPVRTPHSSSPGSGDNTVVTSPPMPTLLSPILGESASTYQPQRLRRWSDKDRSPTVRGGFGCTDAIQEESSEEESVHQRGRLQTPSLLQRDEKQFYQNLLGHVDNFLQDDEDCHEERGEGSSEEDERDDGDSSDETSSDEEEAENTFAPGDGGRSFLYRSVLASPDVHPHINYVSLADFGPSDISMEADAIAMKYLSDEELAKISSEMKCGREGANPLLRNVLMTGLPARMLNQQSMVKSRVEFSFATRKYLEKHGLGDSTRTKETEHKQKKKKKRKGKTKETTNAENKQPAFERILRYDGQEDGTEPRQQSRQRSAEMAVSVGNILDLNKLKTLPKLF